MDYIQLNSLTVKHKFSMPMINELIDKLNGTNYFSRIDLSSGYHQIRVVESNIRQTVFKTHQGLYEFKVMPFSLTNAFAIFQSLMNEVFKRQLRDCVLVFFYDILVYSKDLITNCQHLKFVLEIL